MSRGVYVLLLFSYFCYFYDMSLDGGYYLSIFLCVLFLFKSISVFLFYFIFGVQIAGWRLGSYLF